LVFNMELTSTHFSKLDEMNTLLSISDDLTIAFVHCNEPVLRHALDNEIRQWVENEVFIYDIRMDANSTNLIQYLRDAVQSDLYNAQKKENKKIAFFVFGLDDAIEKKNPDGGSEALFQLNMMREKFLDINHTIILWINSASLTLFEFELERKEQIKMVADFGESNLRFLDKEELEERWDYYIRLLKEFKEKGFEDASKFADWNYNLGMIKLLLGYADEALEYFEESLGFSKKSGDKTKTSNIFGAFGMAYNHLAQVEKAIEFYEKALVISREIGDRQGEGTHLENLGLVYSHLGQVEKTIEFYEKALVVSMDIGDRRGEGAHLGNLGNAYFNLGQIKKAIEYHEKALVITRVIGIRRNEGAQLGNLGLAYSYLGQVEKAIECYELALVIGKEVKDPRIINLCEENLKSIKS